MDHADHARSLKRVAKSEAYRTRSGFGFTGQASVIVNRYLADLSHWVAGSLADKRRSLDVRRAVRGLKDDDISARLLLAGMSVAMAKRFGVDADENKTYRDTAVWIGGNFAHKDQDRGAAYGTGDWGIRGLLTLPIFQRDENGNLVVVDNGDLEALMDGFLRNAASHHPLLSPQTSPPVPWSGFRSGGLRADHWHKPQLVRTNHKSVENIIRHAIATGTMRPVLDAVNALQSVEFIISRPILELVKRVGPPPSPDDALLFKTDKASVRKVRELMTAIRNWEFDRTIAEGRIGLPCYIPLTMDPRGRLVPIPGLNFVRDDRIRGLFLFSNGEPITDDGVVWLKRFVARLADGNAFSDDNKPSRLDLEGRLEWTERNLSKIRDIGVAVLYDDTPDELKGIDDQFQFAAACAELVGVMMAVGDGSDFITRLPVQFDASCSGLQHLCAMARADEGRYVNLGPPPQDHHVRDYYTFNLVNLGPDESPDIYSLVQREVYLEHPEFGDLVHPLERKLAKTPVMTKFYGCGLKKMAKQINDALFELDMSADDNGEALAKAIRATIVKIAPKAIEVFEWLQKLATILAKEQLLLRWPTKLGFPAVSEYHPSITRKMRSPVFKDGKQLIRKGKPIFRHTKLAVGYEDRVKIGKAITAAAANFVHSADACHLQMIALACEEEAIPLVTVHDCFATTANHAGRLNQIIREQFVAMYDYDWLANVWQWARDALPKSVALPPMPARGNLNINDVLNNFHAFS